jgi:hypothetical protein
MLSEACLIGAWQLISNLDLNEDGIASEGPLGLHPKGLLMYGEHGYMSVSMMRTDRLSDAGSGPARHPTFYMGYSGTWRLVDGVIVHEVEVSSHLHMVNTRQIREATLDDDRLTLYATARIGGRLARRVLSWQRA